MYHLARGRREGRRYKEAQLFLSKHSLPYSLHFLSFLVKRDCVF